MGIKFASVTDQEMGNVCGAARTKIVAMSYYMHCGTISVERGLDATGYSKPGVATDLLRFKSLCLPCHPLDRFANIHGTYKISNTNMS